MKLIAAITAIILAGALSVSCFSGLPAGSEPSRNILFSIDYPGAGMGTRAMCAGAEVYVMTDRTIRIEMADKGFEGIKVFEPIPLSAEDYEALKTLGSPRKISALRVRDGEGCDGTSRYITLYDQNDEVILRRGGYMPIGRKFKKTYRELQSILGRYGVDEIITDWRGQLESE